MQVHSNAKTNVYIRAHFRSSGRSCRQLAREFRVSPSTVHSWRRRDSWHDRSSRPKRLRSAIDAQVESQALRLRKMGLTLDECLEALNPIYPGLARATLHRLFRRHGLGNLRRKSKEPPKKFKQYKPGYVHIDTFNLPRIDGKRRYGFLAVDRATRLFFLAVFDRRDKSSSTSFLEQALAFFPFKVTHILTDNGLEYTNSCYKGGTAKAVHPFDKLCRNHSVQHRLTRIRTPKTNGMAERMVQMTKNKALRNIRYGSPQEMVHGLRSWIPRYNCFKRHGSLKMTPLAKALQWYKLEPALFTRSPETLLQAFTTY